MRFHAELESAFQQARNAALARSDVGVAALSLCLWLVQLISYALAGQRRLVGKSVALLALSFVPLAEGCSWAACRASSPFLTALKLCLFALLCWDAGRAGNGSSVPAAGLTAAGGNSLALSSVSQPSCLGRSCSGSDVVAADAAAAAGLEVNASGSSEDASPPEFKDQTSMFPDGCSVEACSVTASVPATEGSEGDAGLQGGAALTTLYVESKLFALVHAGVAFRYSRWQATASLQTVLLAAAAGQTAWQDLCGHSSLAAQARGALSLRQIASLLTKMHCLPVQPSSATSTGQDVEGAGSSLPLISLPAHLDTCKLLLTWLQLCFGWMLPIWAAEVSETYARAQFASQQIAQLQPQEKEWLMLVAVCHDWLALAYQVPMACLAAWYLLVAAAVGAARLYGAEGG